jgi:hypothetical protein
MVLEGKVDETFVLENHLRWQQGSEPEWRLELAERRRRESQIPPGRGWRDVPRARFEGLSKRT